MNELSPTGAAIADASVGERLARAGDGEQRAFAEVYDATAPRVFGLVLRIVMDRGRAEEVTQEVYLEAWRRSKCYDPQRGSAISWLLQIAHSRAVSRVRTSARSPHASSAPAHATPC